MMIQRPAGLDADGYEDVRAVFVHKRFASGGEALRFATAQTQVTHVLEMDYKEADDVGIRGGWRFLETDVSPTRSLQIVSFGDPVGNRADMRVYVTELQ